MAKIYVVRHAKAGSRSHWEGDDRIRPLSKKGLKQADALVDVFENEAIRAIHSSPYMRCVQTVEPLARARGLTVQKTQVLAEGAGLAAVLRLAGELDDAVLSTHGDIVWELVEDLVARRIVTASQRGFDKGSTWVVDVEDGVVTSASYIPAP